jgi:hypothetical protein
MLHRYTSYLGFELRDARSPDRLVPYAEAL